MELNIESLREYCLSKKGVVETLPFDEDTLVYKVMGKGFAFMSIAENDRITLKCDPERSQELRAEHAAIKPGYHMNKLHWNTVHYYEIPYTLCLQLIDHSYDLVVAGLTRKLRLELENMPE